MLAVVKYRGGTMGNLTAALGELRAERKQAQGACREYRPSNLSYRVTKRFGSSRSRKSSGPNYIGSITAQDGAGTTSEMAEAS
jgi:hypothetical protein